MEAPDLVTVTEAATRLGVNKSTVSRQVKHFNLPKDGQGRFDFAAYQAGRRNDLDPTRAGNPAGVAFDDMPSAGEGTAAAHPQQQGSGLSQAKTAETAIKVQMSALKLAEMKGEITRVDRVHDAYRTIGGALQELLASQSRDLSDRLARLDDPIAIRSLLKTANEKLLIELGSRLRRYLPDTPRSVEEFVDAGAA